MERVEYDPEIDPRIREEREAAEREQQLTERIRLEIERYVEEHDLVPREEAGRAAGETPATEDEPGIADETKSQKQREREEKKRAKEENRHAKSEKRAARSAERKKAVRSVVTGSILSSEWMRRMWPWLLGVAALMMFYVAGTFHLQKVQLERQRLERDVRELEVRAMERTAERERQTRRSVIVERLAEKEIPIKEFPHPVKTIER